MEIRKIQKPALISDGGKRVVVIGGLLLAGAFLGAAVISAGASSSTQTVVIGAIVLAGLCGSVALALDVPMIGLFRFGFIASFFFKGDLNLFKINEVEDPSGFNISLTLITAIVLVSYDLIHSEEHERVFPQVFSWLAVALLVCASASVLSTGPTLLGGFSLFSLLTSIFIAYAVASHFSRRDRMLELVIGLAIGLIFTGIVSVSQFALDFPTNLANLGTGTEEELLGTQSQLLSRVPAFMRTPTEMAWVVATLIPIVFAPVICRAKSLSLGQKTLLSVAAFAGTTAAIMSLARGSWLALVIALVLVVLFGWYRLSANERKKYFISAFGGICLSLVLLSPFSGKIYERLTGDDQGSALIRVPLMETAFRMIDDNPLAGVGLNGYRTNMTRYDETGMFVSQVFPNPVHNIFAHITAEVGIPGGIIFCLMILFSIYECSRSVRTDDRLLMALSIGLAIGMVAFVISGTKEPGSLGSVRPPIRTCFLVLGSIFALSRIHRRKGDRSLSKNR